MVVLEPGAKIGCLREDTDLVARRPAHRSGAAYHSRPRRLAQRSQRVGEKPSSMPLYLDTHNHVPGLTGEAVAQAHARDLEVRASTTSRTCATGMTRRPGRSTAWSRRPARRRPRTSIARPTGCSPTSSRRSPRAPSPVASSGASGLGSRGPVTRGDVAPRRERANPSSRADSECTDELVALRGVRGRERGADRIALGVGEADQPAARSGSDRTTRADPIAGRGQPAAVTDRPTLVDALAVEPLRLAVVALERRRCRR